VKSPLQVSVVASLAVLVGLMSTAKEGSRLDVAQTIHVALPPQVLPALRVGIDGSLYLLDREAGRVTAFSADGAKRWETEKASSESTDDFVVQFDWTEQGLRVVTAKGEVRTFDGSGRRVDTVVPQFGAPQAPSPIVASDTGDFYVLANKGSDAVYHFNSDGAVIRSFATLPTATAASKQGVFLSWLRRGSDGSIYYRPEPELVFYRFAKDGSPIETIRPKGIPYRPRTPTNIPGDSVFGTDVLSDGRIIFEVVHRTPYVESGRAAEPTTSTSLDAKLYVVGPGGSTLVLPRPTELGMFAGVGPKDDLYFIKTVEMLKPGEGTTVQRVRADLHK
jgi:hypothetical protein